MFEGDPLQWPHWYGLFKALVHEQGLSDTEKIIYLQSSVKGAAERAVSGMLFDGSMYNQAIKELSNRFDDPGLISKALIRRFLEMPKLQDETPANLRPFVDTLHGLTRTLKPMVMTLISRQPPIWSRSQANCLCRWWRGGVDIGCSCIQSRWT